MVSLRISIPLRRHGRASYEVGGWDANIGSALGGRLYSGFMSIGRQCAGRDLLAGIIDGGLDPQARSPPVAFRLGVDSGSQRNGVDFDGVVDHRRYRLVYR